MVQRRTTSVPADPSQHHVFRRQLSEGYEHVVVEGEVAELPASAVEVLQVAGFVELVEADRGTSI